MSYNIRLKDHELPRLVDRRVRGDMIETYKIMTGKEKLERRKLFQMATLWGRYHTKKIYWKYSRLNIRKNWFSQRVITKWNSLSLKEVQAEKTSCFKTRYDKQEKERVATREASIYVWE